MNKIFEQLLQRRGVDLGFLQPKYEDLLNQRGLPDMAKAGEVIAQAILKEQKILIFGDYDADGVTASAVMFEGLKMAGVEKLEVMLPDRFRDGYGMNQRVLEKVEQREIDLVVTVDCGSNNNEIVEELERRGVKVVVTDHHELMGACPKATAVVNPKRKDVEVVLELKDLAGVGVAFMVVRELVERKLIKAGQEKWLLDLVLIGTLCDSMNLTRQNRILSFYGKIVMEKTRRVGLRRLMEELKINKVTAEAVGFLIGPRINAAGRMASAELALELLLAESRVDAERLMQELEQLNQERKSQQTVAVTEIQARGIRDEPIIVEQGDWHEGILGIVAGRLMEEYKKPSFILAGEEILKGSGRSFGEFNLAEALKAVSPVLIGGGGHAAACGVKLEKAQFEKFKKRINDFYKSLKLKDQERFLRQKADIEVTNFEDLTVELVEKIDQLEPFGPGNESPIFLLKGEVVGRRELGEEGKHLALEIKNKNKIIKVVGFFVPEEWKEIMTGEMVVVKISLMINQWQGEKTVEGRLIEVEKSSEEKGVV